MHLHGSQNTTLLSTKLLIEHAAESRTQTQPSFFRAEISKATKIQFLNSRKYSDGSCSGLFLLFVHVIVTTIPCHIMVIC